MDVLFSLIKSPRPRWSLCDLATAHTCIQTSTHSRGVSVHDSWRMSYYLTTRKFRTTFIAAFALQRRVFVGLEMWFSVQMSIIWRIKRPNLSASLPLKSSQVRSIWLVKPKFTKHICLNELWMLQLSFRCCLRCNDTPCSLSSGPGVDRSALPLCYDYPKHPSQ